MTTAPQDFMDEAVRTISHALDDARDNFKLPGFMAPSPKRRPLRWAVAIAVISIGIAVYSRARARRRNISQSATDAYRAA